MIIIIIIFFGGKILVGQWPSLCACMGSIENNINQIKKGLFLYQHKTNTSKCYDNFHYEYIVNGICNIHVYFPLDLMYIKGVCQSIKFTILQSLFDT